MFRRSGRSYGNATQTIANDPDDWDDLDHLGRIEFYLDDLVNFEAIRVVCDRICVSIWSSWSSDHFWHSMGLRTVYQRFCKNSWQRTSNSDSRQKKDVLKNILFSNYFMLAVFISIIKFSKLVFAVWNFWSFTTKTISVHPCMLSKSVESEFSTLNWIAEREKIRYVYSKEILLNTAAIREVNATEIDSNFTARERGLCAISLQRQATNNQRNFRNFKTRDWIYLQWLSLPF